MAKTCASCLSCLITGEAEKLHRCNNPTNYLNAQMNPKNYRLVDGRPVVKPTAACKRWVQRMESQNAG